MKLLLRLILAAVISLLCIWLSRIYQSLFLSLNNLRRNEVAKLSLHHKQKIHHRNTKSVDDSTLQKALSRNHHINNLRTSWGNAKFIQKQKHLSLGGDNFPLPIIAPQKNKKIATNKHNHQFHQPWSRRKRNRISGRSGKGLKSSYESGSSSTKSPKSKLGKRKRGMGKRKGKGESYKCNGGSKKCKKSKKHISREKKGKGKGGGKDLNSNVDIRRGKGSGKGDNSYSTRGKGKGKGKGKANGFYSEIDFERNFGDDIGLSVPVAPSTIAPVSTPTNTPMSIGVPTPSSSTAAPVGSLPTSPSPMATTSQPTALAPTPSSIGPTPERGLIRIRVSNWYVAYRAPDATTRAPTRIEYDAVLESTRLYIENYFLNYFQINMLDMIQYVGTESLLSTASYGTDVPSFVQQPSPSDNGRFNIYILLRYIEFVYYDTSTPIPDESLSYDLLQSALLTNPDEQAYLMQVPQKLTGTPFESTIDIVFGTVP
jgi:hypothetical protein